MVKVTMRHFFKPNGETIMKYKHIRPELVFVFVSATPIFYGLDDRIPIKQFYKHMWLTLQRAIKAEEAKP